MITRVNQRHFTTDGSNNRLHRIANKSGSR
jgi:hypothetical protein